VAIAGHVPNETVLKHWALHPDRFVPVGSIDPCSCDSAVEATRKVDELLAQGFAGLKLHPRLNAYDPLDERCLATIERAGDVGLVVLLDTLFRQPTRIVANTADIVDRIIKSCPRTRMVLLHSGGPTMLELFELGRMHSQILLDLSFVIMRYRGSSLDQDMAFLCHHLDQRVVIGSDFPEYTPVEVIERFQQLVPDLPAEKMESIFHGNLGRFFEHAGNANVRS
jgi:hypothetical protein